MLLYNIAMWPTKLYISHLGKPGGDQQGLGNKVEFLKHRPRYGRLLRAPHNKPTPIQNALIPHTIHGRCTHTHIHQWAALGSSRFAGPVHRTCQSAQEKWAQLTWQAFKTSRKSLSLSLFQQPHTQNGAAARGMPETGGM